MYENYEGCISEYYNVYSYNVDNSYNFDNEAMHGLAITHYLPQHFSAWCSCAVWKIVRDSWANINNSVISRSFFFFENASTDVTQAENVCQRCSLHNAYLKEIIWTNRFTSFHYLTSFLRYTPVLRFL